MNEATTHCTFQKLPDNIYEITIHQSNRLAVETFFRNLTTIYAEAVSLDTLPVRTLVIAPPQGPLPVIPLTSGLRAWTAIYGKIPSRFVILYEGSFATMVDVLVRNFGKRNSHMRVLSPQRREEAIAWLLV
jgi:hypothetical protein